MGVRGWPIVRPLTGQMAARGTGGGRGGGGGVHRPPLTRHLRLVVRTPRPARCSCGFVVGPISDAVRDTSPQRRPRAASDAGGLGAPVASNQAFAFGG